MRPSPQNRMTYSVVANPLPAHSAGFGGWTHSGRQVRRYCQNERAREGGREGWREGKKDLGFAFLPWNEVNDAMRLLHTKEVQSLSKRLIPQVGVIPLASLPSADASSRNVGQAFLIKSVVDLEMI